MSIGVSMARWSMRVILTALFIFGSAVSLSQAANDAASKAQTMRQTGKQILDVGYEQYRRGMYSEAKATLDKAAAYREYLSVSDVSKLDELLKKLGSQPSPPANQPAVQSTAAEILSQARNFAAKGQFDLAKEKYIQAEQSGQLSNEELSAVEAELTALEQTQASQKTEPAVTKQKQEPVVVEQPKPVQPQQPGVNSQYIEFVPIDANDVNKPQTTVQPQYVIPAPQSEANNAIIEINKVNQQSIQPKPQAAPSPQEQEKESYIEVIKQKQRIQQSYTKAVVNESVAKAKEYADKENFAGARDEISRATAVVEKNKLLLGEQDYTQYTTTLGQLLNEINTRQSQIGSQKAEKAKAEAKVSQENLRSQQAADKKKRIQDLLTHAAEYQEQQRYEESLAETETLLAIDPTNREGLRNKQMLEDIINLQEQLKIKHEIGQQEEAVLTDTQRSMIPHADIYTLPRNWQDIVAKRKPDAISGLSPADAAVYKQLETPVDLSALASDTPFSEAIETIKNSVDPPLKMVVRWKDLADNAYIEPDTAIGMQGMTGIPVEKALKELLNTVSGGVANIDYSVEDGIITIATKSSLPSKLVTNVYDITELVGMKADFRTDLWQPTTGGTSGTAPIPPTPQITILRDEYSRNATIVVQMIQETIVPISWLINGGEGTITVSGDFTKIIVYQTPLIHSKIQEFLEDLRRKLGQQVSIEARFLFVTENFLEDIGMGVSQIHIGDKAITPQLGPMTFNFGSASNIVPTATSLPGSLAPVTPAVNLIGGVQYGSILDDLSVTFFLKAVQAHSDAKMLTAPRVTVLSGERASINLSKALSYVSNYTFNTTTFAGTTPTTVNAATPTIAYDSGGVVLNVTPIISDDKKYVILNIEASYRTVELKDSAVSQVVGTGVQTFPIQLPLADTSTIQTGVSVPDGGTLLIGGQKLGAEVNRESGVPGLSKVPIVGRLFSSRSKVKDQNVLLILVKPTIMLRQEAEREYFAPLEEK